MTSLTLGSCGRPRRQRLPPRRRRAPTSARSGTARLNTPRDSTSAATTGFVSQAFPFGAIAGAKTLTYAQYVVQDFRTRATDRAVELRLLRPGPAGQWRARTMLAPRRSRPTTRLAAGTGVGAWIITHTPLATTPVQPELFQRPPGLRLAVHGGKTNWSTDGLSIAHVRGRPDGAAQQRQHAAVLHLQRPATSSAR
jgi:hypothetical protein